MMNYGYSRDFKSHPRRSTRGSLIEAIVVHSPAIGLPAIRPEDISVMRVVCLYESLGAMSAVFACDVCVQTPVSSCDGYLIIVHIITDVAIAPGAKYKRGLHQG